MKTFVIINGNSTWKIKKESLDDARNHAINICDHSKEIIIREVQENFIIEHETVIYKRGQNNFLQAFFVLSMIVYQLDEDKRGKIALIEETEGLEGVTKYINFLTEEFEKNRELEFTIDKVEEDQFYHAICEHLKQNIY